MLHRYLFGPIPAASADQKLHEQRQSGACLAFNPMGDADLSVTASDDWPSIAARFPEGWQPDFIVLNLGYTSIPDCLWSAPVPLVGLAQDWNLLWHLYRRRLRQCDLVLTDSLGVETLHREGISHTRAANLYGCDRSLVEEPWPQIARDIDILFVGNFNPSVQRDRLPWLARPTRMARKWNVNITSGVFGDDYRQLLARSRIVFNHSIRGECNMRVFEAIAAGALLFQEEGNREVPALLRDRAECVLYNSDNLETLLQHFLEHEEERRAIAEAARARINEFTFARLWQEQVQRIEADLPALAEKARQRSIPAAAETLRTRTWQALCGSPGDDPTLADDLRARLAREPGAMLHNDLGLLAGVGLDHGGEQSAEQRTVAALTHFRSALAKDAQNVLAAVNTAEALALLGQTREAAELARQTLLTVEQSTELSPGSLDAVHFPPRFDVFRVEWERAAWVNAGQPRAEVAGKLDLLRWRLHSLLADWTGELEHFAKAQQVRPDLWPSLAALGCALGRAGRTAEAIDHLRAAVAANPFDSAAARALAHALKEIGQFDALADLVEQRRDLAAGVPLLLREEWFAVKQLAPNQPAQSDGSSWLRTLTRDDFLDRFGLQDFDRAVCGFTNSTDTNIILTLLSNLRPRRILEIGTALGQMTANFTEWSNDDALIFTLGTVADLPVSLSGPQFYETPTRENFGRLANSFGKVGKVFFITADSLTYDFGRLEWIDFAFIDGAHDLQHVLSDSANAYEILRPGGILVWHDFASPVAWVEVRRALERLRFEEPIVHVAGTAVAFLRKSEASAVPALLTTPDSPRQVAPCPTSGKGALSIVWEGSQQAVHSFAVVNRAMCSHLLARGHDVSVLASCGAGLAERAPDGTAPKGYCVVDGDDVPLSQPLADSFYRALSRPAEIHVRHQWPPRFVAPAEGRWVLIQPWEYGSIPQAWVAPMTNQVDEVWAYSHFVRDCYIESGVPADRVHVVPLGVDSQRFHPKASPLPLPTSKRFKFLFVGGTLHRKGIDILLKAYAQAFTSRDDVCLVIKDMGVGTFYRGQTAENLIRELQQQPNGPEIVYLTDTLSEGELAGLYTACDCLVHPYRGEGFALPIAEAMACALPVIVTGAGPAIDFCDEENSWLIPARRVYFADKRVGDIDTVSHPWLLEPDGEVLASRLRHVFAHPDEARGRGQRGCDRIRSRFTWEHAVQIAESRLRKLLERPVCQVRHSGSCIAAPAAVPQRREEEAERSGVGELTPTVRGLHNAARGPHSGDSASLTSNFSRSVEPLLPHPPNPPLPPRGEGGAGSLTPPPPLAEGVEGRDTSSATQAGQVRRKGKRRRSTVSLCMIVKNEESNLPACLDSVADLVDEIVVVDTGSTDATRDIAARYGARVFDFPWIDSFAAARNESLKHARKEWIFWLDADDRIDRDNRGRLRLLFDKLPFTNVGYVMKCLCLHDQQGQSSTVVDHVRLFRNKREMRWEFRVHEQIVPALRRFGHKMLWSDVMIRHVGYQDHDLRQLKLQRDLRLLRLENTERPDHPFTLFNLGSIAQELGRTEEALPLLLRSLELSAPLDSITRKLYALVAQCHRLLGHPEQALEMCRTGRQFYPYDVELLFQEGLVLREQGKRNSARECWLSLLQPRSEEHFASIDTGLMGYKTRHNLAILELEEGNLAAAEVHWRRALAEKPDFAPALAGLDEIRRQRQRKSSA